MRILVVLVLLASGAVRADGPTIRVMTLNMWGGGMRGGEPLSQTAELVRAARADAVGLQEALSRDDVDRGAELAALLGWHHLAQPDRTAIISRHPIAEAVGDLGAAIELPGGARVYLFNVHYYHTPYQPYQLLKIPYDEAPYFETAEEAVAAARLARGEESDRLIAAVAPLVKAGAAVFVTGDFNEPSHRDWTARAAAKGLVPLAVRWPATAALEAAGFTDAYRAIHPDETVARGYTWTPTTAPDDPKDKHDRIDFVFAGGPVRIVSAEIVGEAKETSDIVVTPYPSDHRAVVCEATVE